MRITKDVERKRIENIITEIRCDICGKVAKGGTWVSSEWEVNEVKIGVTLHTKEGQHYPETAWGTEYNVDLCPTCFADKLLPWLKSQGAQLQPIEYQW